MSLSGWLRNNKFGQELLGILIGVVVLALFVWTGLQYHGDPGLGTVAGLLTAVGFFLWWPYKVQSEMSYNFGPVRRGAAGYGLIPGGIIVFLFADVGGLPEPAVIYGSATALVFAAAVYPVIKWLITPPVLAD